jgi:hypothetical protein
MEKPTREELTARLHALLEDALDTAEKANPDGFDLGVVGVVFEVLVESTGSDYLKRSDAGYTPADDIHSYLSWWCSDHRAWIQEAFFEQAYRMATRPRAWRSDTPAAEADEPE